MKGGSKGLLPEQAMLGYSDGDMGPAEDTDPFACKLGGRPLWLDQTSAIPDPSASVCEQCGSDMALLVQAYVPLADSPYDRVLYVWSCNRRACTGKPGAARAIRGHLLNKEYAMALIKSKKGSAKAAAPKSQALSLFGGSSSAAPKPAGLQFDFGGVWNSNSSGLGASQGKPFFSGPLFGRSNASANGAPAKTEMAVDEEPEAKSVADELQEDLSQLAIKSAQAHERTEWPNAAVSLPPQYMAFEDEELGDARIMERYEAVIKQAQAMIADSSDSAAASRKSGKQASALESSEGGEEWAGEKYERATRPKGTDAAFEHFTNIVGQNPEQVMRYKFSGHPLFYTLLDETAKLLNPARRRTNSSEAAESDDDDDDDDDDSQVLLRGYSTDGVPKCPHCKGRRVFECQLMPATLSVLPLSSHVPQTPAALNKSRTQPSNERLTGGRLLDSLDMGMEFGTMMVFVCENDCHGGKTGTQHISQGARAMDRYSGAAYYEELVLVQLESHVD